MNGALGPPSAGGLYSSSGMFYNSGNFPTPAQIISSVSTGTNNINQNISTMYQALGNAAYSGVSGVGTSLGYLSAGQGLGPSSTSINTYGGGFNQSP